MLCIPFDVTPVRPFNHNPSNAICFPFPCAHLLLLTLVAPHRMRFVYPFPCAHLLLLVLVAPPRAEEEEDEEKMYVNVYKEVFPHMHKLAVLHHKGVNCV